MSASDCAQLWYTVQYVQSLPRRRTSISAKTGNTKIDHAVLTNVTCSKC